VVLVVLEMGYENEVVRSVVLRYGGIGNVVRGRWREGAG
jgi:hypothetical protein